MATTTIDPRRVHDLNDEPPGSGTHVLYWMQASVRTRENHALEYAVRTANELSLPLVVGFGLDATYPDATPRTLRFLVDGLVAAAGGLDRRGIPFVVQAGTPFDVVSGLVEAAAVVVTDRNYLREPRQWRERLARRLDVPLVEVESNVVIPVEVTSGKREWAARTIRPKIHEHLDDFLEELTTTPLDVASRLDLPSLDAGDSASLCEAVGIDPSTSGRHEGGEHQAQAALDHFLEEGLGRYEQSTTEVTGDASSHLSMYLHYGHISPARIARSVRRSGAPAEAIDGYIEELVVRRELAHNFVWYEPRYDAFSALPDWARTTLEEHRDDERQEHYTRTEMEEGRTADRCWNAAMLEMKATGYLHNRMRMYWGKRIMEWTNTPEYAFRVALDLNNTWLLDGRDPSSYANVAWLFGLHDQAFAERPITGKTRPMTRSGLERKIDTDAYVSWVEGLTGETVSGS